MISQSSQMKENKENVKEVAVETVVEMTEKCKTKNCKQKYDELCSMRMCSVCCLRVQNKARAFNEKNLPKKRVSICWNEFNRHSLHVLFITFNQHLHTQRLLLQWLLLICNI